MLLAIDSGNTNTVFGLYESGDLRSQWRTSTDANRTADEYAAWLGQLLALESFTLKDIGGVIIASVVPQGMFNLRLFCRRYFDCEPLVVTTELDLGIEVRVERPSDVGADRLVNAVAAHQTYQRPLIIIDFGTATTLDIIDEDGNYVGGVIAPGINLSLDALHRAAAKLPRIAVERPARVIGGGTIGSMIAQVARGWGAADVVMVDRMPARQALAADLGFDHFVLSGEGDEEKKLLSFGGPFDIVFDNACTEQTIELAANTLEIGGTMVTLTFPHAGQKLIAPYLTAYRRELHIVFSRNYARGDWDHTFDLMSKGAIDTERMISGIYPLDRFVEAMDDLRDHPEEHVKVVISP